MLLLLIVHSPLCQRLQQRLCSIMLHGMGRSPAASPQPEGGLTPPQGHAVQHCHPSQGGLARALLYSCSQSAAHHGSRTPHAVTRQTTSSPPLRAKRHPHARFLRASWILRVYPHACHTAATPAAMSASIWQRRQRRARQACRVQSKSHAQWPVTSIWRSQTHYTFKPSSIAL